MNANAALLRKLSAAVASNSAAKASSQLRAMDACLSVLNARLAMPNAVKWFLRDRLVEGRKPDKEDPFWWSHVTPEAARELRRLARRVVVLFNENRYCSLVGNSAAAWTYSALAVLPRPASDSLQASLLERLCDQVARVKNSHALEGDSLCYKALDLAPPETELQVRFTYENPDTRLGHSMMCLEVGNDQVVQYWPSLDEEFNEVEEEVLAEACEKLKLQHTLPMQLATFFAVVAAAKSDGTENWGGFHGVWHFDEGNLPFVLNEFSKGKGRGKKP